MSESENYIEINKEAWNIKTGIHINSEFYDLPSFIPGKNSLNEIELNLLGNIEGKKVLHLQCHFGQDTISLGRMGAEVTGVDFSEKAIETAIELAEKCKVITSFICSDIYDLPANSNEKYDLIFTSYGTIGWLPDIKRWAKVVSHFLKPGGRFVFADFHPVVWMFDTAFEKVQFNYFNADAIVEKESGTYADRNAPFEFTTVGWNHGMGEVISALLESGLRIESLKEYDYSPYPCFENTIEFEPGKFRISKHGNKLPLVYSIVATNNF